MKTTYFAHQIDIALLGLLNVNLNLINPIRYLEEKVLTHLDCRGTPYGRRVEFKMIISGMSSLLYNTIHLNSWKISDFPFVVKLLFPLIESDLEVKNLLIRLKALFMFSSCS